MSSEDVDAVLARLGGYGRYQWLLFVAMGLVDMVTSWHTFVLLFVGWTPEHHCTPWANHTYNQSLRREENSSEEIAWSQCSMYDDPGSEGEPHGNTTVNCQLGWTYVWDREGETSIVSDWDLVCEHSYVSELSMTVLMVGSACGTLFLSPLPDRWGRKTVMLACLLLQTAVSVALVFAQGPVGFVILQFFQGSFHTVSTVCGNLILVETLHKDTRVVPLYSLAFFWAGGQMLLSPMAYLFPQWRHLQLAITLPTVLMVAYVWLAPESLSWLLIKGKTEQAKKVIMMIGRVNKLPLHDHLDKALDSFKRGLPVPQEKIVLLSKSQKATGDAVEDSELLSDTETAQDTRLSVNKVDRITGLQPETYAGKTTQDTILLSDTIAGQDTVLLSDTKSDRDTVLLSNTKSGRDTALLSDTKAGQDFVLLSSTEAGGDTILLSDSKAGQDNILSSDTTPGQDTALLSDCAAEKTTRDKDEVVADSTSYTILDLFRTPRIRRYSLIMLYLSLVTSLAYFGISFSMPSLSGDKYINTFISGAVECPAIIVIIIINRRIGRRPPFCVLLLICAGANITEIFLPDTTASGTDLSGVRTALVMLGKFGITGAYSILILFGTEVFPTSIRSHALGLCLCFESFGSIISPQIVYAAKSMTQLPMTLFSVMTVVGAVLVLFLPDTHNAPLPHTIEDVEQLDKKKKKRHHEKCSDNV